MASIFVFNTSVLGVTSCTVQYKSVQYHKQRQKDFVKRTTTGELRFGYPSPTRAIVLCTLFWYTLLVVKRKYKTVLYGVFKSTWFFSTLSTNVIPWAFRPSLTKLSTFDGPWLLFDIYLFISPNRSQSPTVFDTQSWKRITLFQFATGQWLSIQIVLMIWWELHWAFGTGIWAYVKNEWMNEWMEEICNKKILRTHAR